MIQIGEYNTLKIKGRTEHGFILSDGDGTDEVLLPNRDIDEKMKIGDMIDVFIYVESDDLPTATTIKPLITLNKFELLRVKNSTGFGAFVDWGLPKDLLVPISKQSFKLKDNQFAVIALYQDNINNRLLGSTKIKTFLNQKEIDVKEGDEVDIMIFDISKLGVQVIVNNQFFGLVYNNEIFQPIKIGDRLKAYVKRIREDKKLDISLQKIGFEHIDTISMKILDSLKTNNNFIALTDKSDPVDIEKVFHISKKAFKKAIGSLYKKKLIEIKEDGIYLLL